MTTAQTGSDCETPYIADADYVLVINSVECAGEGQLYINYTLCFDNVGSALSKNVPLSFYSSDPTQTSITPFYTHFENYVVSNNQCFTEEIGIGTATGTEIFLVVNDAGNQVTPFDLTSNFTAYNFNFEPDYCNNISSAPTGCSTDGTVQNCLEGGVEYNLEGEYSWMRGQMTENNGKAIIAFSGFISGTDAFCGLGKINKNGEIEWMKAYKGNIYRKTVEVFSTSDGGIVSAAQYVGFSYLQKTDTDGNLLWSKEFKDDENQYNNISAGVANLDGGMTLSGSMRDDSFSDLAIGWVIRLDAAGNTIWRKDFALDSPIFSNCYNCGDIQRDGTGNYYVTGTGFGVSSILKLTANGDFMWMRTYAIPSSNDPFITLKNNGDGLYLLSEGTVSENPGCNISEFDTEGNLIRSADFLNYSVYSLGGLSILSDGNLLIKGECASQTTSSTPFLLKIDADFNILNAADYTDFDPNYNSRYGESHLVLDDIILTINSEGDGFNDGTLITRLPISLEGDCGPLPPPLDFTSSPVLFIDANTNINITEGGQFFIDFSTTTENLPFVQTELCNTLIDCEEEEPEVPENDCNDSSFEITVTQGNGAFNPQPLIIENNGAPLVHFSYGEPEGFSTKNNVLIQFDNDGQVVWSKKYDEDIFQIPDDIATTPDGSIYTIGGGVNFAMADLRKTDINGNQLWHKEFKAPLGASSNPFLASMTPNNIGGVTLLGNDFDIGINFKEILVINLNADGEIVWKKKIGDVAQSQTLSASRIIQIPSGEYIIVAYADDNLTVLKITENGDLIFSKTYDFEVQKNAKTLILNESQTGFYFLYRKVASVNSGLAEIDFDGNLIRAVDFETASLINLRKLSILPNGKFIVEGKFSPTVSALIKLDADWNVEDARNFNSGDQGTSNFSKNKTHSVIGSNIYQTWSNNGLIRLQKIPSSLSSECPSTPIEISTVPFVFSGQDSDFQTVDFQIDIADFAPETYDFPYDYAVVCSSNTTADLANISVEFQDSYCQSGTVFLNYSICNLGEEILAAGLPVSAFGQDPTVVSASPTQTFNLPESIAPSSCYEGAFQVEGYDEFYLVVNEDGTQTTPFDLDNFSSEFVSECTFLDNIAAVSNIEDVALFIGTQSFQFCEGEPFEFNGLDYTESATVSQNLPSSGGCDSISITQIEMLPQVFTEETLEYLEGETATVFGSNYTEDTVVQQTFNAENGCDSTHQVTLVFLAPPSPECEVNSFQMSFSMPGELVYGTRVIELENAPLASFYLPNGSQIDFNCLTQFDNQGQVIWSKNYNYAQNVRVNELLKANDGGILVNSGVNGESILQKTDANGNWQWSKKYTYGSLSTNFNTLVSETNGALTLAGQTIEGFIVGNRAALMHTDNQGFVIWKKRFAAEMNSSGDQTLSITDMIKLPSGEYIVTGKAYGEFMLAAFSNMGEFLWGKHFDKEMPYFQESIVLNEDQTGFYILYESGPNFNLGGIGLAEFDLAGNQLFAREYTVDGGLTPGHLTVLNDGSLVIDGSFQFFWSGPKSPFFLRLDANKEIIGAVKQDAFGDQSTVESSAKTHAVIGENIYSIQENYEQNNSLWAGSLHALPLSLESECTTEDLTFSYTDLSFPVSNFSVQELDNQLTTEDLIPQVSNSVLIQNFACESSAGSNLSTSETLQFCAGETAQVLGNEYTENTVVEENLVSISGCDSLHQIEIIFLDEIFTSETVEACEGETISIFGNNYTSAGVFQETSLSFQGCDSTHQVFLNFNQPTFQNETFQVCEGDIITVFGNPVTESGDYSGIFIGSNGCDSTLTISITFLENVSTSESLQFCAGEIATVFGNEYTESTVVQQSFNTPESCDSTHTVTITFFENVETSETIQACTGETLTVLGQTLTENTLIEQALLTEDGCDSLHQIEVIFLEEIFTSETIEACEGETISVFGNNYTASGVFEETFLSFQECDSTHQVILNFNQPTFQNETFQACEGDIITVFGNPVTESGDYSGIFIGSNGCDSTLTISVNFLENISTSESLQFCEGEIATVFGNEYTESTVVEQTFNTAESCDSTHTVTITFFENVQTSETIEACEGETLTLFGQPITEDTTIEQPFLTENGCDSLHSVIVVFTDIINTFETVTGCTGEALIVFGNEVFDDTVIEETFLSNFGCDSVHQITVLFLENATTFETLEFCEGESTTIFGNTYTENSIAEQTLPAENGCDSTHQVTLIFNEVFNTEEIFDLCEGESVFVFGNEITSTQTLSETFTAENGCDSIHQISVTVFENVFTYDVQEYCEGETAIVFGNTISENDVLTENFNSQNGCDSLHEITVIFNEEINIFLIDTICYGDSLEIFDALILNSGNYEFISPGIDEDCDTTRYLSLEVLPEIQYELPLDTLIPVGMGWQIPLQTSNDNLNFEWSPADNLSCTDCQSPLAIAETNQTYTVLITNELGCSTSARIKVAVDPVPAFFIPQAFSPNGDEANDYFTVFGNEKIELIEEMQIFDRWGTLIFSQQNFAPNIPELGWNGIFREQKANSRVFLYVIRLRQVDGKVIDAVGDVLLTH